MFAVVVVLKCLPIFGGTKLHQLGWFGAANSIFPGLLRTGLST
jgi:hypothetical protein